MQEKTFFLRHFLCVVCVCLWGGAHGTFASDESTEPDLFLKGGRASYSVESKEKSSRDLVSAQKTPKKEKTSFPLGSLVHVRAYGGGFFSFGTGTLVTPEIVLTAAHVVFDIEREKKMYSQGDRVCIECIAFYKEGDGRMRSRKARANGVIFPTAFRDSDKKKKQIKHDFAFLKIGAPKTKSPFKGFHCTKIRCTSSSEKYPKEGPIPKIFINGFSQKPGESWEQTTSSEGGVYRMYVRQKEGEARQCDGDLVGHNIPTSKGISGSGFKQESSSQDASFVVGVQRGKAQSCVSQESDSLLDFENVGAHFNKEETEPLFREWGKILSKADNFSGENASGEEKGESLFFSLDPDSLPDGFLEKDEIRLVFKK